MNLQSDSGRSKKRVLAISSGGGHWIQLRRLAPGFADAEVLYAASDPKCADEVCEGAFRCVGDFNRWNWPKGILVATRILLIGLRWRPDIVITTGAAPGLLAIIWGRLLGARTIWIDSIANVGEVSMSGRMARRFADLWLTQWEHLAKEDRGGPLWRGSVL